MSSPLFDAHNHLQDYDPGTGSAEALRLAAEAGVELMLCNGTSPGDWEAVLALAAGNRAVIPCFGLHPWFLKEAPPGWLEELESFLLRVPSCVGEIGLDGGKNASDPARQEGVFTAQLRLAKKLGRPACVHCVKAWGRLLVIIKEEAPGPFLLHSYGGPPELMAEFASLGAYFSFSGALMDGKREKLRRALLAAPPERLLFETEAPAKKVPASFLSVDQWGLAAMPKRRLAPFSQGPAGLVEVIAAAAKISGRTAEELSALSWANGKRFTGR